MSFTLLPPVVETEGLVGFHLTNVTQLESCRIQQGFLSPHMLVLQLASLLLNVSWPPCPLLYILFLISPFNLLDDFTYYVHCLSVLPPRM